MIKQIAHLCFLFVLLLLCGACNSDGSSTYSAGDNCSRGAVPSTQGAGVSSQSTSTTAANPEFPNLDLCTFNAIYTDSFPAAYADNPKLAKGAAPYTYYSYGNLAQAYQNLFVTQAGTPLSLNTGDTAPFDSGDPFSDSREIAAFLANINQETNGASPPTFLVTGQFTTSGAGSLGAAYGLTAVTEGSCATAGCPAYGTKQGFCQNTDTTARLSACDGIPVTPTGTDYCSLAVRWCSDTNYPPNIPANEFFGRGSKQLTHAYNYIWYGSKIDTSNPLALANTPNSIDSDGVLGWEVGLAYWAIPFQEPAGNFKPSMHEGFFNPTTGSASPIFDAQTGFGKTINIINGGIECGSTRQFIRNTTLSRIQNYIELLLRINPTIPINRVEVTKADDSVDVYTLAQLINNIQTQNPLNLNYDPTTPNAAQLVKQYTQSGTSQTSDYASYEPTWTMQWGGNGRYNSAPLLQEYNFAPDTPDVSGATNVYNNGTTQLKKIMMFYDSNPANLTQERLDCAGIPDYSGN